MSRKNFMKIIHDLQKEINTMADSVQEKEGKKVSRIEIDLALEKLRKTYDALLNLSLLSDQPEIPAIDPESQKKATEESSKIDEKIHQDESETSEIDTDELMIDIGKKIPSNKPPVTKPQTDLFSGQFIEDKKNDEKQSEQEILSTVKAEPQEKEKKEEKEETRIAKEKAEDKGDKVTPKSVGEKIQKDRNEETIADKIQKNKISSLKIAIGINEKFFFINELFNGSLNEYNKSIEELDGQKDLQDALAYLNKLQQQNMWYPGTDAFEQLKQFVERKFV